MKPKNIAKINILVNIILFVIKFSIGKIYNSLSILSDSLNSLVDIITALAIFYSIKINEKEADHNHPFGHTRAESIVGYTIGILTVILGLKIIQSSISRIINPVIVTFSYLMFFAVGITVLLKSGLLIFIKTKLKENSPALKANMQDHFNDIVISIGVLISVIGIKKGFIILDTITGSLIGLYIIYAGVKISKENIKMLMGEKADEKIVEKIKKIALKCKEVKKVSNIKTQMLGNKVQVEIHIKISKNYNIKKGREIADKVKIAIEKLKEINNCFVYVDSE